MTVETTTPEDAPVEVTDTLPEEVETPELEADDSDQSSATGEDADNAEEITDPEAEKAALRQADYTRKTQELAEIRKALSERTQKLDTYVTQGEALVTTLVSEFQAEFNGIDWGKLAAEDPAQYVQKRHSFDERQRKLALAVGQLNAAKSQQAQLDQESTQQRLLDEQRKLIERLPEWKDTKKATAESAELREYLTTSGYEPNEVNGVTDHRAVILARKAMLYDKLMKQVPKAVAVPAAPPPPSPAPSKAKAAPNPDRMTTDEWLKWRNSQLARNARG